MAHHGQVGRVSPDVLRRLSVRARPAPLPTSRRRVPLAAKPSSYTSKPWPGPARPWWMDVGEELLYPVVMVIAVVLGVVAWQGVRVLQQPHPTAMSTARAVDLILLVTVMPPAVWWVVYRWFRPRAPTSPWEGKVLPPDPGGRAELMASPAGALARAAVAVACLVALLAVAVRVTALAWIGVPLAAVLAVILVAQLLRPTVLVVDDRGFGIRSWRVRNRLALPWTDVAEVGRGQQDAVQIVTTQGPDGELRPWLELRGAGTDGAEQITALLASYLAAHRAEAGR